MELSMVRAKALLEVELTMAQRNLRCEVWFPAFVHVAVRSGDARLPLIKFNCWHVQKGFALITVQFRSLADLLVTQGNLQ